jgi:hypothetical protein
MIRMMFGRLASVRGFAAPQVCEEISAAVARKTPIAKGRGEVSECIGLFVAAGSGKDKRLFQFHMTL